VGKDYLKKKDEVSPFSHEKLEEYLSRGLEIQHCSHGESGGLTKPYKEMLAKAIEEAKRRGKKNEPSKKNRPNN
jgi:hypothetical protein|tara:strand:+ start:200 stop:421 length:222 start_codon:yes stop_codon:yes gene_type:complete